MPPNPPPHEGMHDHHSQQPPPVKQVQRAKTMKSTASKVGRFFKKTGKDSDKHRDNELRSISSASSQRGWDRTSFGGGPEYYNDALDRPVSQATSYYGEPSSNDFGSDARPTSIQNDGGAGDFSLARQHADDESPEVQELLRELEEVNTAISHMQKEVISEADRKHALQQQYEEMRRMLQQEEQEYQQIEHRFFEHTRSVRATDDDLSTIRDTFKLLKYSIARLVMSLNKKADMHTAASKFASKWPTLIPEGGSELEPVHINLLAEKLVHEHLVYEIFKCPVYPGMEINDAYASVSEWMTANGSDFAVRLRQQLACIIAKSSKDSELQQAAATEKKRIVDTIYQDLADVYSPFLREHDAKADEEKRYINKVSDIVEKALKLTVAIRGQEVDISTLDTKEGEAQFDPETMVDVKGKTTGKVRFCICPPFIGGDGEHGFVEKGKVVVA
ncbi:hypothetical protein LRAMOSA08358 [Lichtheimia ramosa]|uniref:Uncharacterized protein n=1 Tax=Lichtheimia ramosa TaxID=688394 RepID=A0A077WEF4_9FUNG|nr:hypothetical protein LRAMOSA08358 [Lichtheimia ramosa]